MPKLTPIKTQKWVTNRLKRQSAFGNVILRTLWLPVSDILPEHFVPIHTFEVEMILVCLQHGAWLDGADWQPFARYAIAKRLKERSDIIFQDSYAQYKDAICDFQLHGGRLAERDRLKKLARSLMQKNVLTPFDRSFGKLVSSITTGDDTTSVIHPFHWIRTCLGFSQSEPIFGMNLVSSENTQQKETLCAMLRASIE